METQERDATNRASFKCTNCIKTFTDLEAGELFDMATQQFKCTFCKQPVEEDETTGPKKDSRLMLARFNEQMEVLYELLRKAEDIRLAPELLEPEPPRLNENGDGGQQQGRDRNGMWSGEATRMRGLNDQRIDFKIGDSDTPKREEGKERPVWMFESTIGDSRESSSILTSSSKSAADSTADKPSRDDIMSVLLTFEKKGGTLHKPIIPGNESDSDLEEGDAEISHVFGRTVNNKYHPDHMEEEDEDDEIMEDVVEPSEQVPLVTVGKERIPVGEVNADVIARMTVTEKDAYIQLYHEMFGHLYD
jgi:transcription initiation factor TFIIE subunit alpha